MTEIFQISFHNPNIPRLLIMNHNGLSNLIQTHYRLYPDGHFKIPHLWPGQNPPPEVSTYPPATEQNEFTDVGLKDPYFFLFSSNVFPFAFTLRDGRLF